MWDIPSQTKIKLAILKNYLAAWATVLKSREEILYYIDGFAGPGWYNDPESNDRVPGSPVQAVQLYLDHRTNKGWEYELRLINVEKDKTYFQELIKETSKFEKDAKIKNILGEFLDKLNDILPEIKGRHSFFFIDPFGISGIEFSEMEGVLRSEKTEILLNFNYDGLQRCIGDLDNVDDYDQKRRAKAIKTIERVCRMLDVTEDELRQIVTSSGIPKVKETSLLKKYVGKLKNYKPFVYPLPINFPGKKRTFYYLIFMTQNIIALKIMKDVMKKAKKMEEGEQLFFPLPEIDIEGLKRKLYEKYAGKVIEVKEIYKDWLPKVFILDGEDYLARDIDRALKMLFQDKNTPVKRITGRAIWNPSYKFG